jgi:4-diphosphocytidyl-2-C-methyl-D-erythritol kinase
MILYSSAKINIGLHVLRKRDDGFHDIATLMHPIHLHDILELHISDKQEEDFIFTQSGLLLADDIKNNLCYKAWHVFFREVIPVKLRIHLHKQIPFGAGLAGGSSNATTVLKGLNALSGHTLTKLQLHTFASWLGSDCSFFVENVPAIAEGRGDQLSRYNIDLTGKHLVLINPGIHMDTSIAYNMIVPDSNRPKLSTILKSPLNKWKDFLVNDFETPIFKLHPSIEKLKMSLYNAGAIYASLSGSGSSVYGIFNSQPKLENTIHKLIIWEGIL